MEYKSFALGSIGASTTTHAYEGFDRTLHKWVYTSFGSDGGYGTTYSDGWKNSVKIYTPASDKPQVFRLIATKVGDNAFTEEVQVPSPGGTWKGTERGLLRCKRAPVKR